MRINLLYFIDSLCEASALAVDSDRIKSASSSIKTGPGLFYVNLLQRDLEHIVLCAVPESRDGLMNIQSTLQVRTRCFVLRPAVHLLTRVKILENWRTKRVIDPKKVDHAINSVQGRKKMQVILLTQ
jgi:CTD kinase subunit gamma